jgi:hypothetical protein
MKRIFTTLAKKWPDYLLEVMVITIGILGAFALNSWNERAKSYKEEQLVLRGLQAEFKQNLDEIRRDHYYNALCLDATKSLLQLNGQPASPHKVDSLIGHALNYASFEPRLGVVNDVTSSGKINLIQDEHLRYLLTQWSGELNDLGEDNLIRRDHYVHELIPIIGKYIYVRNADSSYMRDDYAREQVIESITRDQTRYDAMLAATDFDGALYAHFMNQTYVFTNEETIENFMNEILLLIAQNIEEN